MDALRRKSWSPYVIGAAIGVLSWFAFATADRQIGITTAFEYTAALAGKAVAPEAAARNAYYVEKEKEKKPPRIDWEWMLVVGVFMGSWGSSRLSGDRPTERVPALWGRRFGDSVPKRYFGAFIGGFIMMFGARMAQGCTSGHAISGVLQLALSSWVFTPTMFAVAAATAFILYRKERHHV